MVQFTIKQINELTKQFVAEVNKYESKAARISQVEVDIFNEHIIFNYTGQFFAYNQVLDASENCKVKGFNTNPVNN